MRLCEDGIEKARRCKTYEKLFEMDRHEIIYAMTKGVIRGVELEFAKRLTAVQVWFDDRWRLHRVGGPAFINENDKHFGRKVWYRHGKKHREDGPAVVWMNGVQEWFVNGKRHRVGAPAITDHSGNYEEWWVDGELHREDGPAAFKIGSYEFWFRNGKQHRVGGPALITMLNGVVFMEEWWLDGKRHREDGPAIESEKRQEWWLDGELHREDGPAVIDKFSMEWWVHGKRHREDGPAVVWDDGTEEWYEDGKRVRIVLRGEKEIFP